MFYEPFFFQATQQGGQCEKHTLFPVLNDRRTPHGWKKSEKKKFIEEDSYYEN